MSAAATPRRLTLLVTLLLAVELLDELYSGVPSVGSADIQAGFAVSYGVTAWALLLVPGGLALLVEPLLFLLADRHPRKWFVCGGLFAMGAAALLASVATHVALVSAALTLAWIGSGSAVNLAQATLVDARPHERERVLTRWTLLGEVGDLLAPALMAGVAVAGASWRSAFVVVGVLMIVWGVWLSRQPFEAIEPLGDHEADEDEPTILEAFRQALGERRLMFWLGATALCDLLDEIVVVFAALYLRDQLGLDSVARSAIIAAAIAGAIVGVMVTDRLLKTRPAIPLLFWSSVACAVSYVAWLAARDAWSSGIAFFFVGVFAAPMYPITSAQAYAALPGRSGTVNAAGHVFTPFTLAAPWLLGLVADRVGLLVALAALLLQPVGLTLVAGWSLRRR